MVTSPSAATVPPGGTLKFTAEVTGTADKRVVWEIVDPSPARSPADDRVFEEPFTWLGHHAATIARGTATTIWWDPDAWDVHAETTHNTISGKGAGHHIDIHEGTSNPASGVTPNTAYALGGDGSPGVGVMHLDFETIASARLRNPLLIAPGQPGIVEFRATNFVTTGHWWEIALTPASTVIAAEFTAIPSTGDTLNGNPGPGNGEPQESLNLVVMGESDVPCRNGWRFQVSLAKAQGDARSEYVGPSFDTDPSEKDKLYRYRLEYYPDRVEVFADLDEDGALERLHVFKVTVPWPEVHVHLLGVAYQADHHPQGDCFQGQVRELPWRDVKIGPVKYARTAVFPREDGTSRIPLETGWLGYDLRDTQRHGVPIKEVSQPNAGPYDKYYSLALCSSDSAYGCDDPVSSKSLTFVLPAEDAAGIASARFVYDIRRSGSASLTLNGAAIGPLLGARTVRAKEETQWVRRSIDVAPARFIPGKNTVKVSMSGDVQLDRMHFEFSYATAPQGRKGTLSSTGIYTAPSTVPSPPTVAVRVRSAVDPSKTATALVVITARDKLASGADADPPGTAMINSLRTFLSLLRPVHLPTSAALLLIHPPSMTPPGAPARQALMRSAPHRV